MPVLLIFPAYETSGRPPEGASHGAVFKVRDMNGIQKVPGFEKSF